MVTRYSLSAGKEKLTRETGAIVEKTFSPAYNAGKGTKMPVLTMDSPTEFQMMEWGLIPFNAKDASIGDKLINARLETVRAKNPFADLLESKRCLVPMDGFYVWDKDSPKPKVARVTTGKDEIMMVPGVYERWQDEFDDSTYFSSFSILTTAACTTIRPYNERMACIMHKESWDTWFNPKIDPQTALKSVSELTDVTITIHEVSSDIITSHGNDSQFAKDLNRQTPGDTLSLF